ncbi:methyltransferase [Candidatus Woesearchaeota archaeon]|nr:methyltransferase [Candidatus Woesearchaeota archaeon]
MYEPQEESFMLREEVRKHAKGRFLDMGTGSGILAQAAQECPKVTEILAVDLNVRAVRYVRKLGINAVKSDLFKKVTGKFDTIVFNAPYLPADVREKKDEHSMAVCGGKKGYEITERFFNQVSLHLAPDGIILLLFSSLTNKKKIDQIIKDRLFESKLLLDKRYFFENVYIYLVRKSDLLNELESKHLKDIRFFAKGKRGIVYGADYLGKKVAVKVESPASKAVARIKNEIHWLKELNRYGIGPEFYFSGTNWFVMDFVEGERIIDFLKNASKHHAKKAILNVLKQLFELDYLKINKEELNHPYKHIIIDKHLHPVLIDFERAGKTTKPKNISQFVQFLICRKINIILSEKRIKINRMKMLEMVKKYKGNPNKENYHSIIEELK